MRKCCEMYSSFETIKCKNVVYNKCASDCTKTMQPGN